MKSSEIKKIIRERFALNVRVRTVPGKRKLIQVWLPAELDTVFPNSLRVKCYEAIYAADDALLELCMKIHPSLTKAIRMTASQWEQVLTSL